MKAKNIYSVCCSYETDIEFCNENGIKIDNMLKRDEYSVLCEFCAMLQGAGAPASFYDGYFLSYSIPQISNEFDLLRFCEKSVINIELKSDLSALSYEQKTEKIRKQLAKNHYYLKFLNRQIFCYCFVSNDGLYKYDHTVDTVVHVEGTDLLNTLSLQNNSFFTQLDLNSLFVPKNYLVSPFNNTDRFMRGEYFLTDAQANIKKDILAQLDKNTFFSYCVSANAGTGKTLLVYDIARELIARSKNVLVVHSGILNDGHIRLIMYYGWHICAIKDMVLKIGCASLNGCDYDVVIFDEAQRMTKAQIDVAINRLSPQKIPVIFSYDVKQYLKQNEAVDVYGYLEAQHGDIQSYKTHLTNKIRTNKEIASFITNLFTMGKSNSYTDYSSITVDYFDCKEDVKSYLRALAADGYKSISFTVSRFTREGLDAINNICDCNAHAVIGQEFDKVVFVMDDNFRYSDQNILMARENYYDARGMLYQIVTRAVSELKIVVLGNKQLYKDILKIKYNKFPFKPQE